MSEKETKKENIHKGHRDRVKKKFLDSGFGPATPDHEILEMLLFYSVPQKDTNPLAHEILDHFGSFANVLEAKPSELMKVNGVSEHTAALIKLMLPVYRRYKERKYEAKVKLETLDQFAEYIAKEYIGEAREIVRIFLFNNKSELVGKEVIAKGDISSAVIDNRKIIETIIRYDAVGIILAHNHPQGFAIPSQDDQFATLNIKRTIKCVGAQLYDHVIIADNKYYSMQSDITNRPFFG